MRTAAAETQKDGGQILRDTETREETGRDTGRHEETGRHRGMERLGDGEQTCVPIRTSSSGCQAPLAEMRLALMPSERDMVGEEGING